MPSDTLTCKGTVRTKGGEQVVLLDGENCPGCDGRCRLRFSVPQLTLPAECEVQDGTTIEIATTGRRFVAQATLVFGVPLLVALLAAAAVEWTTAGAWLVPAALLAAAAALTAARLMFPRKTSGGAALETDRTPLRLRIF